ncbi:MAG: M50 family metallopeptidase [Elusimicrobiales bacterium]|nr:M50 family metallopeptidase [Elusimicrobiales bacterium]
MRWLKPLIGIALAPAALAAVWATGRALGPALGNFPATAPLLGGALAGLLLHTLGRGRRLYVASHELTHALAAVLTGVKVRKISVRKSSGYVLLDSTNAFISLAPYFVPFYTLAVSAAFWTAGRFWPVAPYRPWFLAAAGFTLAFHLLHTADILAGPVQSDLRKAGGPVFSLPLLVLLNCVGLAAALRLLFPGLLSLRAWWGGVLAAQAAAYGAVAYAALYVFNTAKIYFRT